MGVEEIRRRTAERKAEGKSGVYPQHAGKVPAATRTAVVRRSLPLAPCANEGGVLERCHTCTGEMSEQRSVRECDVHGKCTRIRVSGKVMDCDRCRRDGLGYAPEAVAPAAVAARPIEWSHTARLDATTVHPHLPGRRFNGGIIPWEGGYVFAWRDGWVSGGVWATRMDAAFSPVGPAVRLAVDHPEAGAGQEDPQLFVHRGRLHAAVVGVVGRNGRATRTNVLYCRLAADLSVEATFAPKAPGVDPARWEKNWQWFEHGESLYAVYAIDPHRVLKVDGGRCEWAHETPCPWPWAGGERRGGATPVLVGDEFWCFFHDSVPSAPGKMQYRVGLYTFDAAPPFAVRRAVPGPVLTADATTNGGPGGNYSDVIFPRGAVRLGDEWVLASGVHDRWTELRRLSHADLDRRLVRLAQS